MLFHGACLRWLIALVATSYTTGLKITTVDQQGETPGWRKIDRGIATTRAIPFFWRDQRRRVRAQIADSMRLVAYRKRTCVRACVQLLTVRKFRNCPSSPAGVVLWRVATCIIIELPGAEATRFRNRAASSRWILKRVVTRERLAKRSSLVFYSRTRAAGVLHANARARVINICARARPAPLELNAIAY